MVDENKDAVDELVTGFVERIENEINAKDMQVKNERNQLWQRIQNEITEAQHMRGRAIISEIIQTTNDFTTKIRKYSDLSAHSISYPCVGTTFENYRAED